MRRRALLLGLLLLAACGFAPAYGPGGGPQGRVAVEAPDTPDGFRLRAALEDRLGPPGPRALRLAVTPEVASEDLGSLPGRGAARLRLDGRAAWRLLGPEGELRAEGNVAASASAPLAGPAVSVRAAESEARARLMAALADRILARLILEEAAP
jgi:LPS-assembly lipoprotein